MTRRTLLQSAAAAATPALQAQTRRRNIVFVLCDDHRFDYIGALGHPWLKGHTPNLDRLLRGGVHFRNAFVTSSLCSPSRASILSGQYMHAHKVYDNFSPFPSALPTFPQILKRNGYRTGFIGKWHMGGDSDAPQPGFDHWVSFRGQGDYENPRINKNGQASQVNGYMTDILTGEASRFIKDNAAGPFCLYLSHKAIHYPFVPHPRHANLFQGMKIPKPASMIYKPEFYDQLPRWVHDRRFTRHGVDGLFGHTSTFDDAYRGYCQALLPVDESLGEVLNTLEERRLLNDTLVIYMGDNGYMWGEHGLVDKRAMYEPSIRVPMIAHCPDLSGPKAVSEFALNLDIAPTLLDAAGLATPPQIHGRSLIPVMQGRASNWRKDFVYEYEWEQDYPYTPTMTGLRTERHSFTYYHGIWDINELYDLEKDPDQMKNLIADMRIRGYQRGRLWMNLKDERRPLVDQLQTRLQQILAETGGEPRRSGKGSEGDQYAL
ncbi:MAG: sulfatase [Acidobacteria bacterium]|nr:sulfatase [Acidobacteriota bacterium]